MEKYEDWSEVYPRPQLRRDSFLPLTEGWKRNGKALRVPWEHTTEKHMVYELSFDLPEEYARIIRTYTGMKEKRILLHFGAVDQVCSLTVNGQAVGSHAGGYLPFSFDVTEFLKERENRLVLTVADTLDKSYGYGKQSRRPHGMWYTQVSGIWQPVWLEAVPARGRVERLKITPDLAGIDLEIETEAAAGGIRGALPGEPVRYEALVEVLDAKGSVILQREEALKDRICIRLDPEQPHQWTPEDPYLYGLRIRTRRLRASKEAQEAGEDIADTVMSYFALRTVTLERRGRHLHPCLNGKAVFLNGVLDQGYFEDGFYLPADPREYRRDILRMKEMGFNLLRKHLKIEPEVFYYECDRQGMLVLQDMVSSGHYSFLFETALPTLISKTRTFRPLPKIAPRRHRIFLRETKGTIDLLYNHPCIIGYTIFNEGWGQFRADRLYDRVKQYDPTRFCDSTSGWFRGERSDVRSEHIYFRNEVLPPAPADQFLFLSECGGYSRAVPGHMAKVRRRYGYGRTDSEEALTRRIAEMYEEMVLPSIANGLSGVVLTQLSDVESEINGLYTFDRAVCKVNAGKLRELAERVYAAAAEAASENMET